MKSALVLPAIAMLLVAPTAATAQVSDDITKFDRAGSARAARFSGAMLEPPDGRVYHGVGQYQQGVDDYIAAMEDTSKPILVKLYFDIPGTRGQNYAALRQSLARERAAGRIVELSLGLQDGRSGTDSVIAVSTRHDAIIDSVAKIVREHNAPLFVRPGFEFNGSWFGYHQYLYVTAFRKIVDRFRAAGVDSAAYVWCYYPSGAANDFDSINARGALWYPGDEYVDWFGLDLFNASDFDLELPAFVRGTITAKGKSERFLATARLKQKPVLLSETSAKGTEITASEEDGITDWKAWFEKFFAFIDAHGEIKGFNYINWDWRAYATWSTWGNARIDSNAYILAQYRQEMRRSKYIHLGDRVQSELPLPSVPELIAPEQNAALLQGDFPIRFVWNASGPQVDRYRLQVDLDSLFTRPFVDSITVDTQLVWIGIASEGWWRVTAHNETGWSANSAVRRFRLIIVGVGENETSDRLISVTPNPSNGDAHIRFAITESCIADIIISDDAQHNTVSYRQVHLEPGEHTIQLADLDLPSGVYSCVVDTKADRHVVRFVVAR